MQVLTALSNVPSVQVPFLRRYLSAATGTYSGKYLGTHPYKKKLMHKRAGLYNSMHWL